MFDMVETLKLIKPKRINDTNMANVLKDYIVLEFGATKIVAPFVSKSEYRLPVKDLFSDILDNATPIKDNEYGNDIDLNLEFNTTVTINNDILTSFSSISQTGEDTFWLGCLSFSSTTLNIYTWSQLFYCQQLFKTELKIEDVYKDECNFISWDVYYYLFQMFKNLTGKKKENLYIAFSNNKMYLTDEERSFYIITDVTNRDIVFKSKYIESLTKYYEENRKDIKSQQLSKKAYMEGNQNVLLKHMIRSFDDVIEVSDSKTFIMFKDSKGTLFLNKDK